VSPAPFGTNDDRERHYMAIATRAAQLLGRPVEASYVGADLLYTDGTASLRIGYMRRRFLPDDLAREVDELGQYLATALDKEPPTVPPSHTITINLDGIPVRTPDCDSIVGALRAAVIREARLDLAGHELPVTLLADHPDFGRCSWVYANGIITGPTPVAPRPCPATYSDEQYPCSLTLGHTDPHHFRGITWHDDSTRPPVTTP
jgi:hypothetical protein